MLVKKLSIPKNVDLKAFSCPKLSTSNNKYAIVVTGPFGSIKISLFDKDLYFIKKNNILFFVYNVQLNSKKHKEKRTLARLNFAFVALKHSFNAMLFPISSYLKLVGVGFKIIKSNNKFELSLGYSHSVILPNSKDFTYFIKKDGRTQLLGFCSFVIDDVTNRIATIYNLKKPSVYSGKGFQFIDQEPFRKEGKGKFQR
jgi:large subunit ribosomal protein L6